MSTSTLDLLRATIVDEQLLRGIAAPLPAVSGAGQYSFQMDSVTNTLQVSVNAGAYFQLATANGPAGTLQQAYDGGGAVGAGTGRTIATMTGGAVVMTNAAAAATNTLELNKTPAAAQAGACLFATMNANGTASVATLDYRATAGTVAGALRLVTGAATVLAGNHTGFLLDMTTLLTSGANQLRGIDMLIGPSSSVTTRGILITSTATGAGAACIEIAPAPAAPSGVRGFIYTGTANAQGNVMTITDPALIADATSAIIITQAPAATASTDRLGLSINYNPTLVPAGGINSGAAASRLVLINNSPINNAAQILTIRRALLDIVNAGDALLAGSTVTDQTPLLRIQHTPTQTAGTYNDNAVVGAAITMTSPAASTCIGETITMSPAVASACTGLRVTVGANMTGPATRLVSPGAGVNVAFVEMTGNAANDAAAPAANELRFYARTVGGKVQLAVRFPTGAVQTAAIEP